jgi:hypothetical protein
MNSVIILKLIVPQYKYKKKIFNVLQPPKHRGKECDYMDKEIIYKVCDKENILCDPPCNKEQIETKCDISKCETEPNKVVKKISSIINKDTCEMGNIVEIPCLEECSPINCKYEIGDFGKCSIENCNNKYRYYISFKMKIKGNSLTKLDSKCKTNLINSFINYLSITEDKIKIDYINYNDIKTHILIEFTIKDLNEYKKNKIYNLLLSINIDATIYKKFLSLFKCDKIKPCELIEIKTNDNVDLDKNIISNRENKQEEKYNCSIMNIDNEPMTTIIKDCYADSNLHYCNVMEPISKYIEIYDIREIKKSNVIKKRSFKKIHDAMYGGICDFSEDDLIEPCEDECPQACIGEWRDYGTCYSNKCPTGEAARNVYLKRKLIYKVLNPSSNTNEKCFDHIYKNDYVDDNEIIEIDCDELCPIDGVEEKTYSECNIYDDCGERGLDGFFNMEEATGKQVKRKVIWKEITAPQGKGRPNYNIPQLEMQLEPCDPIKLCPINCVYNN